ncbi:hypothetical protein [Pseudomonas sp.]|uniref:hypothetical protein n=1 Tax=Pseudomonas sp. TaxID=306 RepID=UPI0025D19391|nr:hypothetical protein [Pseudomonas sp.]
MHSVLIKIIQYAQYSRRLLIGLGIVAVTAFISACGNENNRSHISPEEQKCIDYTKNAIEARGENYSRYTDKKFEDGEPVWVAGRRFDFEHLKSTPDEYRPTFRNPDVWKEKGKFIPGVTLIYRDSVSHMKETMSGVISTDIDPGNPKIIILMNCKMGATPSPEKYLPLNNLTNKLIGGPSGYAISLNEELGFYQALGNEEHADDYFYRHRNGAVDMSFPIIFCGKDISSGICSAKITAWENIVLIYRFPRRQLSDFTRVYQATKDKIDAALAKGEQ